MEDEWAVSFLAVLLLLAVAVVIRVQHRSWLSPAAFWGLVWAVILLSSVLFVPDYLLRVAGVAWILGCVLIVSAGADLGHRIHFLRQAESSLLTDNIKRSLLIKRLRNTCFLSAVMGMGAVLVYLNEAGASLGDVWSIDRIFEIAHAYSFSRYSDRTFREPELAIFLSSFIYLSALLGGTLIALSPKFSFISIIGFIPALCVTIILTTRASFLFSGILWISAYLATSVALTSGKYSLFTGRRMWVMSVLVVLAISVYVIGQVAREGDLDTDFLAIVPIVVSAFLGSPSAFTLWFSDNWYRSMPLGLGERTFAGPLGFEWPYFDATTVGSSSLTQQTTTVHTLYRELIHDYSLTGSMIVLFVLGLFGGWAFRKAVHGKPLAIAMLSIFYCIALNSLAGFPFAYTTICFAWGLYASTLLVFCRIS